MTTSSNNISLTNSINDDIYWADTRSVAWLRNSMELKQEVTIRPAISVNHRSLIPKPRYITNTEHSTIKP